MRRTLCLLLMLGFATATLLPSLQAGPDAPAEEVKLFLNRSPEGKLTLTENAPSARNATTWTLSGTYSTSQGLKLQIPLADPRPDRAIDESRGVRGWVTYAFKQTPLSSLSQSITGYRSGVFEWMLVEGERSNPMAYTCVTPNATRSYYCDAYEYVADFPGHGPRPQPHTHGDGSDAQRGLTSGDVHWLLAYSIPPCTFSASSPYSACGVTSTSMRYEFTVRLDGSTFVRYAVLPPQPQAPVQDDAAGDAEGTNETAPANSTTQAPPGNQTGNASGSSSQGNSFQPRPYTAQKPEGTAPGAGVGVMLATLAVGLAMRRRRA